VTLQNRRFRVILNQDGAAILDTNVGKITTLNSSGAFVWQALERGEEIETIIEGLARTMGEHLEVIKGDVLGFVEVLKKQDLLPG
jgi:hypothetical protein